MDSVNMNVSMFSFANVPKICPFFSGRRALAHFLLDTFLDFDFRFCISNQLQRYLLMLADNGLSKHEC